MPRGATARPAGSKPNEDSAAEQDQQSLQTVAEEPVELGRQFRLAPMLSADLARNDTTDDDRQEKDQIGQSVWPATNRRRTRGSGITRCSG